MYLIIDRAQCSSIWIVESINSDIVLYYDRIFYFCYIRLREVWDLIIQVEVSPRKRNWGHAVEEGNLRN